MRKLSIALFLSLTLIAKVFSQDTLNVYKYKPALDGSITAAMAGLSYVGLKLILRAKPPLDSSYVVSLNPNQVNAFDRGATRKNLDGAGNLADIALFSSYGLPLALLFDGCIRHDAGKIGLLYLETMSIMGVVYTWGVGLIHRNRPFVYNKDIPLQKKLKKGANNSFFAGHPASAAAATFFAAKVFHDYHPHSNLRYIIWPAALIPPAIVAYYRYRGGEHFPTDIVAGITIGAAIGILVPEIHRIKNKKDSRFTLEVIPNGFYASYNLHKK